MRKPLFCSSALLALLLRLQCVVPADVQAKYYIEEILGREEGLPATRTGTMLLQKNEASGHMGDSVVGHQEPSFPRSLYHQDPRGAPHATHPLHLTDDTSPLSSTPANCFSAFMSVLVQSYHAKEIRQVLMKDLKVGDRVLTHLDPLTGERIYEPVYAFGHQDPDKSSQYYVLTNKYAPEEPLELTPRHWIYAENKTHPIPAYNLIADTDLLLFHQVTEGKLHYYDADETGYPVDLAPMTSINVTYRKGLYQPLTKSGTIVVNKILCSAFAHPVHPPIQPEWYKAPELDNFVLHDALFMYLWMAPYRVVCSWGRYHCQTRTFLPTWLVGESMEEVSTPPLWWLQQSHDLAARVYHPEDPSMGLSRRNRYLVYVPILAGLVLCVAVERIKSWPVGSCIFLCCLFYWLFGQWHRWKGELFLQYRLWKEGKPLLPIMRRGHLRKEHKHIS